MAEYRVLKVYNNFFAHQAYELQIKRKFWRWFWWETIESDHLGINGNKWAKHYNCVIVESED